MNDHPRYRLGLPEMDVQHDYCYHLFDAIDTAAAAGVEQLGKLLHEIEIYLMFHFECEEHLMRMYGFPHFAIHQTDHEQAGNRFIGFLDDFEANRLNHPAMKIFLTGWLMEHSSMSDKEYTAWVLERRAEIG